MIGLHGGRVRAESPGPNAGATFTCWLPLDRAPAEEEEVATADHPLKVLIIEDNYETAEKARHLLEHLGHRVHLTYSGPTGLEAARLFHPDAVLCDLRLPGFDGLQVARALRRNPATADLFLVALLADVNPDPQAARQAGFDRTLAKPLDPHALQAVLADAHHLTLGGAGGKK
jgi:CheY-like chemotaxis protein